MDVPSTCTESGCTRPAKVRGLCLQHYAHFRAVHKAAGTWDSLPRRRRGKCSVEGCDRPAEARGLCTKHYQDARKRAIAEGAWCANDIPGRRAAR